MDKVLEKYGPMLKEAASNLSRLHVKLQEGNRKTGSSVWTVSLMPVFDCKNCAGCRKKCYDLKHDVIMPTVLKDRVRNSAIHRFDPARYWHEIGDGITKHGVRFLRINVGGDMTDSDFDYVAVLAKMHPETEFLFFTKNYGGLARRVRENGMMPANVHAIVSRWPGMPFRNPFGLPEAHVRMRDGKTTAPKGAIECGGNCSACAETKNGCFGLARYQSVVFNEH